MAKYTKNSNNQKVSPETVESANSIAQGTQKLGQSKEQTKLISQGIQKGIEQFKKQQKLKSKQQNKNQKKRNRDKLSEVVENSVTAEYKQHWMPWVLLVITWIGIFFYWLFNITI